MDDLRLAPLTCAFGTRLDPRDLLVGLDDLGLPDARLVIDDAGITLACSPPDACRDDVARAMTWLRARFSPLVQLRLAPLGGGPRYVDARRRPRTVVALAEVTDPDAGFGAAVGDLFERIGAREAPAGDVAFAQTDDGLHAGLVEQVVDAVRRAAPGLAATVSVIVPARTGARPVAGAVADVGGGDALHVMLWMRPGGETGIRPAVLLAASGSLDALRAFERMQRDDGQAPGPGAMEILLDGLAWRASRRPTVTAPPPADRPRLPIVVDPTRCTDCDLCAQVCPEGYLGPAGVPALDDPDACTRCMDCVDACPADALRPTHGPDGATRSDALAHRPGWLARITGAPGPSVPAPFPPSFLLPRRGPVTGPRYVLGLAVMTQQEHAAALLKDGAVVGAVELERINRVRHAGWHPSGRPGVTAAVDPTICLEETLCRGPVRALLEREGITLDDVEVIAVNGLHGRYVSKIPFLDASADIPSVRAGRALYLPHHRCHAASALRSSGLLDAWVLTVDGRGDRECAAVWRATGGVLALVDSVLALNDRSVGGVYEGVTRLLGFGSHGQGSVMALASFGSATVDLSRHLGTAPDGSLLAHEDGINETFAAFARSPGAPIEARHQDLAASLQRALEDTLIALLRRAAGDAPLDALCLAGGVALNCRMNERLRQTFSPGAMFVQPGANDAGTALGAVLEAWARHLGPTPVSPPLAHAALGPDFDDAVIERALRRSRLRWSRVEDVAEETASRLASGQVVCWFQGPMEFGPRALGGRSIVADPRDSAMHARVNALKQREPWRPFGPSILAGREGDWLERAFDSRFMLFALPVLASQRARVPAVVHVDGTTRPQVVHPETHPRYHAMIAAFERLTGVPMVLDTSFNRRGEPIVCTPEDALDAFVGLGADALAIGSFVVERPSATVTALPSSDDVLAALPGGRRLSLRLTTHCDLDCGHCTLRDLRDRPDRSAQDALRSLAEGREAGCDELVILRGEASLRRDLPALIARARRMGYRFVQLQTDGRPLAASPLRDELLRAGVDAFEVQFLAADEATNDRLAGVAGTFRATATAVQALARSGRQLLVTVPVLRQNLRQLASVVVLAQRLGVRRVQFNFPRPVDLPDRVVADAVPRLAHAALAVRQAARVAAQHGITVTTEAFPLCVLPEELHGSPDATEDWSRHRVDDLHMLHDALDAVRGTQRPEAPACRECSARDRCPKTWAAYLELFGSGELRPLG